MNGEENIKQKSVRSHNVGNSIRNNTLSELSEKKMGGGKKKLTLKQMVKMQTRRTAKKESKPRRPATDKKAAEIILPNLKSEKVMAELKKMRAITPYAIASRLDIRQSVARDLLKELERRGTIEYVSGSKNLKIYKLPD